jgi:CIC family chloride channel protein
LAPVDLDLGLLIKSTGHSGFPVIESDGELVGMVTRQDINKALGQGDADAEVSKVMTRDVTKCFPDETLKKALHRMAVRNVGRIPVVERDDKERIIGLITRKSIINAYNQALEIGKSETVNFYEDKSSPQKTK